MSASTSLPAGNVRLARAQAIAEAWLRLDGDLSPLSNGSGRPLARTVKLVLDPLVIRPVQHPHLAGATLTPDAADELAARLSAARDDLVATAEWFRLLKSARRALHVTAGNPQEKYFQRCFELARAHGAPGAGADATATETVLEIAGDADDLLARVRAIVQETGPADALHAALVDAWAARRPADPGDHLELMAAALDACGSPHDPDLVPLVAAGAGTAATAGIDAPGAARELGLTRRDAVARPELGTTASTRTLPPPFDRSVFERLFATLSGGRVHDIDLDADELLDDEITRTAAPWELADEQNRVVLALGAEAAHALEPTELLRPTAAHRLLRGRWEREAYVRRVRRLPAESSGVPEAIRDDVRTARHGYLRRLWVRLHGRELRGIPTTGAELWDTLDGALRSVVMDQRHRLKLSLGCEAEELS